MPVKPSFDPSKVRVYGPGVGDVSASLPVSFCIDTSEAGIAELEVSIQVNIQQSHIHHGLSSVLLLFIKFSI